MFSSGENSLCAPASADETRQSACRSLYRLPRRSHRPRIGVKVGTSRHTTTRVLRLTCPHTRMHLQKSVEEHGHEETTPSTPPEKMSCAGAWSPWKREISSLADSSSPSRPTCPPNYMSPTVHKGPQTHALLQPGLSMALIILSRSVEEGQVTQRVETKTIFQTNARCSDIISTDDREF